MTTQGDTFRVALERALGHRPAVDPPSPFRASLAQALAERAPASSPADEEIVDLRFRAQLADAVEHRPLGARHT